LTTTLYPLPGSICAKAYQEGINGDENNNPSQIEKSAVRNM
jgi:hypothetical protein